MVLFLPPSDACVRSFLSPLYFNKTLLHKSSEQSSLVSGPGLNSSPPEAKKPAFYCQQQPFSGTGRGNSSCRNWESMLILKHSQFPREACACQINSQDFGCIIYLKIRKKKSKSIFLKWINKLARLNLVRSDPWTVTHLHFLPLPSSFPALPISDLPSAAT